MPEDWRIASDTPVFKKDLGNYRPVSLTSVPGKVLNILFWRPLPSIWKRRRLWGVVSMDSPREVVLDQTHCLL